VTDAENCDEVELRLLAFNLTAACGVLGRAVVRVRVGGFSIVLRGIELRHDDAGFAVTPPKTKRAREPFFALQPAVAEAVTRLVFEAARDAMAGKLDVPDEIPAGLDSLPVKWQRRRASP
jgi:hypothetical protein